MNSNFLYYLGRPLLRAGTGLGLALFMAACSPEGEGASASGQSLSRQEEQEEVVHLYYLSADRTRILSEQWSPDFSRLIETAEIPWQVNGTAEGGLQADLADSPILQAADDQSSFVLRTSEPQTFTGLGPEEENTGGAFRLYLYKSATAEFREIYVAGGDSVIGNFLYVPDQSAVYFEIIRPAGYSLNRLELRFPLPVPTVLHQGTNELFRLRYDASREAVSALVQNQDEIIELSHKTGADTLVSRVAGKIPSDRPSLPAASGNGSCVVCPLVPTRKFPGNALRLFCADRPEQDVYLADRVVAAEPVEPEHWLALGLESLTLMNATGNMVYRYCCPEPALLAVDQNEYYIRSADYTLRFREGVSQPDTLAAGLHEKFFDLLFVRKGLSARKRI